MYIWASSLNYLNPSATPALLTSLETAAQFCYNDERFNRNLTHKAEYNLLVWLKVSV
ncbi:hypothetical protein BDQ17DRAFT_460979 [Cyathus striatus]|nr:hypothetical protein BDQ17DRAFT_460979 [Cyathus striatus]